MWKKNWRLWQWNIEIKWLEKMNKYFDTRDTSLTASIVCIALTEEFCQKLTLVRKTRFVAIDATWFSKQKNLLLAFTELTETIISIKSESLRDNE